MATSVIIGLFGFLMAKVLTNPGEIFGFIPFMYGKRYSFDLDSLDLIPYWIAKITFACSKCIAGNLALWYSLIWDNIGIFENITIAIFIGYITTRIHERYLE